MVIHVKHFGRLLPHRDLPASRPRRCGRLSGRASSRGRFHHHAVAAVPPRTRGRGPKLLCELHALVDILLTQRYRCGMLPDFNQEGLLPPGIHAAEWNELLLRFGYNLRRMHLLTGLRAVLESLKNAGCRTAYIDGSFVTYKEHPNDFDGCWEEDGVDPYALDPVLLDLRPKRLAQKEKYYGELFPASVPADPMGLSFLEFFQTTDTGDPRESSGSTWRGDMIKNETPVQVHQDPGGTL